MNKEAFVHRIFSIPIIQFKFCNHLNYVFQDFPKSEKKPDGWVLPLNSSFPNIEDTDVFVTRDVRDKLAKDLIFSISEHLKSLSLPSDIRFKNFWYNIYHNDQGQEPHDHLPKNLHVKEDEIKTSYWCGVYYAKNSSSTKFYLNDYHRSLHIFKNHEESDLRDCFWTWYEPKVKDGDIILFPPYLNHGVEPIKNKEEKMRLTFSFNMHLISD